MIFIVSSFTFIYSSFTGILRTHNMTRALHRHRRGHGFESRSSRIFFFRLCFRNCLSCVLAARIFLLFDLLSAVQNACFIYLHSFCQVRNKVNVIALADLWYLDCWALKRVNGRKDGSMRKP